jgi:hypothetical protein
MSGVETAAWAVGFCQPSLHRLDRGAAPLLADDAALMLADSQLIAGNADAALAQVEGRCVSRLAPGRLGTKPNCTDVSAPSSCS